MKIKTYIIIIGVVGILAGVWFTSKNHYDQKLKIELLEQNEANRKIYDKQLAKKDSTHSTLFRQMLSKKEFEEMLDTRNKALKNWIEKENNIKLKNVKSFIHSELTYINKDTTIVDLSELRDLILKSQKGSIPFSETIENCMIIGGSVIVDGEKIRLEITDKQFNNTMKGVAYIDRKAWKLLFFTTKIFGKRELKLILEDSCGKSHTMILDISKRK